LFAQAPLTLGLVPRGGNASATLAERAAGAAAGPRWFREMDRNRDGDISPREFLGGPDTFLRLDEDHDGLIDAREATAATTQGRAP
jgi:hypothetical protein